MKNIKTDLFLITIFLLLITQSFLLNIAHAQTSSPSPSSFPFTVYSQPDSGFTEPLAQGPYVDIDVYTDQQAIVTINGETEANSSGHVFKVVNLQQGDNKIAIIATKNGVSQEKDLDFPRQDNTTTNTYTSSPTSIPSPPSLSITFPTDGYHTTDPTIMLQGTTDIGATIKINSYGVPNNYGTFSFTSNLSLGKNTFSIIVYNNNQSTPKLLDVYRDNPPILAQSSPNSDISESDLINPVKEFYSDISSKQLDLAWNLTSANYHNYAQGYDNFVRGQQNTISISVNNIYVQNLSSNIVFVNLTSVDRTNNKTQAKTFEGTWKLAYENNTWKLDSAKIDQVGETSEPSPSPQDSPSTYVQSQQSNHLYNIFLVLGSLAAGIISWILFRKSRNKSKLKAEILRASIYKSLFKTSLVVTGGFVLSLISDASSANSGGYFFWGGLIWGGYNLFKQSREYFKKIKPQIDESSKMESILIEYFEKLLAAYQKNRNRAEFIEFCIDLGISGEMAKKLWDYFKNLDSQKQNDYRNRNYQQNNKSYSSSSSDLDKAYQTLGVKKGSSREDIKTAYRKKAIKLHPDVNNSSDAGDKFKELNRAYKTILDSI